jgi:hypothetical protein
MPRPGLQATLLLVASSIAFGCGEQSEPRAPQTASPTSPTAPTPGTPAVQVVAADAGEPVAAVPDARVCPKLDVDIPAFKMTSKHDVAVPDIDDYGTTMDGFYAKLAKLVRGEPVMVRIGFYGDSNLANDRTLGYMRRQLQDKYGDGGHGWVAFGKPWVWYKHMDIETGTTGSWASYNLSNQHAPDYFYGFGGTAAESTSPGSTAWVATAGAKAPTGTKVTAFEIAYLARPNAGSFEVAVDGTSREVVDTAATEPELRFAHYDVDDGAHKLVLTIKKGRVRVFGAILERNTGIVVDSLGIASLNPWLLDTMDHKMAGTGLAHRNYDLLLETSGSNMCASKWLKSSIGVWRDALPHAALALWSPPDAAMPPNWTSEPLMQRCAKEKRDVATANQLGFWDLYAALGGPGSMPRWLSESRALDWCEPDGLHLAPGLNKYIAERFIHAMLVGLDKHLQADPQLGCDAGGAGSAAPAAH